MKKDTLSARMYAHYCSWQSSGLSQRRYSAQHGLRTGQFNYWVVKFQRHQSAMGSEPAGFVPLVVESEESGTPVIEIHHRSGHRISFFQRVDAAYIKSLL